MRSRVSLTVVMPKARNAILPHGKLSENRAVRSGSQALASLNAGDPRMSFQIAAAKSDVSLSRRRFLTASALLGLAAGALMLSPATAYAGDKFFVDNGAAIGGYDPVAYFEQGHPVAGNPAITADWEGATWHFSSAVNRDLFLSRPEDFAPQYGGYCSYAAAKGYVASTDPEAWAIVDGKLYLNYSKSVHNRWEKRRSKYIADADANWPGIRKNL